MANQTTEAQKKKKKCEKENSPSISICSFRSSVVAFASMKNRISFRCCYAVHRIIGCKARIKANKIKYGRRVQPIFPVHAEMEKNTNSSTIIPNAKRRVFFSGDDRIENKYFIQLFCSDFLSRSNILCASRTHTEFREVRLHTYPSHSLLACGYAERIYQHIYDVPPIGAV